MPIMYKAPLMIGYGSLPLTVLWVAMLCSVPIFISFSSIATREYQDEVGTIFFFSIGVPQGGILVEDFNSDPTHADFSWLLVREGGERVFVTTSIVDQLQEEKLCDWSPDDVGVDCVSDQDCIDHYDGASAAYCIRSSGGDMDLYDGTCYYEDYFQWCTLNSTTTVFDSSQGAGLGVTVIARTQCTFGNGGDIIFSNYNRRDEDEQFYYDLSLASILSRAENKGESLSQPYSQYFERGLDMAIEYNWECDLDMLNDADEDRYACPIDLSVTVISSSSITETERTFQYTREDDGRYLRRKQYLRGFRLRFIGAGACTETTVYSILGLLAEAVAIQSAAIVLMIVCVKIWHKVSQVPEPVDVLEYHSDSNAWLVRRTPNYHSGSAGKTGGRPSAAGTMPATARTSAISNRPSGIIEIVDVSHSGGLLGESGASGDGAGGSAAAAAALQPPRAAAAASTASASPRTNAASPVSPSRDGTTTFAGVVSRIGDGPLQQRPGRGEKLFQIKIPRDFDGEVVVDGVVPRNRVLLTLDPSLAPGTKVQFFVPSATAHLPARPLDRLVRQLRV